MNKDEEYINRCFQLALNGIGNVAPNPLVGAVIVFENKIIGEGFHGNYGENHAEVNAINSVKDKSLLRESTLYVNLEPCCHYGKTPPCTDLIIKHKIKRVVISNIDPFYKVNCSGISILRSNNINVITGILESEGKELNRRFFTFHNKRRPYIILKWAQSIDGFIDKKRDNKNYPPTWITDEYLKILVHRWRTEEASIMIGKNTALLDNPMLTARLYAGKNPLRLVIDPKAELKNTLNIFNDDANTIVFNGILEREERRIKYVRLNFAGDINVQICDYLYQNNIQSVIVEGGTILLNSFIKNNIWDEARVFIGNKYFGDGVKAPHLDITPKEIISYNEDKLIMFKNSFSNDN